MKRRNLFVLLAVAAASGGFLVTTVLLRRYSDGDDGPGMDGDVDGGGRRSLLSKQFKYRPRKVIQYQPDTDLPQHFVDKSSSLNPYPLRDPARFTEKNSFVLPWLEENFADLSPCLDFRCRSDASQCDNNMQTEYDGGGPDGTAPPCCSHVLRDMLHAFDDGMTNLGLNYFVGFGTLLGFVRGGRVVPWTIDNDIVLEDIAELRAVAELWNRDITGMTLVFPPVDRQDKPRRVPRMCATRDFAGGRLLAWEVPALPPVADGDGDGTETILPALFHDRGHPYIDFYYGENLDHGTWGGEYRRCRHFRSDVFPTQRRAVYNGQFALNFPARPVALLNRYYGEDWTVPKRDDSPHGEPTRICEVNYGLEEPPPKVVKRRMAEVRKRLRRVARRAVAREEEEE